MSVRKFNNTNLARENSTGNIYIYIHIYIERDIRGAKEEETDS